MASVDEMRWQQRKEDVQTDIAALMALGLTLDTARRLAGWNETLDYDTWADVTSLAWPPQPAPPVPANGLRQYLTLEVSRSDARVNAEQLNGAVLDAGVLYAIFVPDIPELTITQIAFELNGSPVHTEFSKPWDYNGTLPGGEAARISFVAGNYTISANVVDAGGFYNFDAAFTVE